MIVIQMHGKNRLIIIFFVLLRSYIYSQDTVNTYLYQREGRERVAFKEQGLVGASIGLLSASVGGSFLIKDTWVAGGGINVSADLINSLLNREPLGWEWSWSAGISYYYNIDKRLKQGKKIDYYSGNYIGLGLVWPLSNPVQVVSGPVGIAVINYNVVGISWGLNRVFGKRNGWSWGLGILFGYNWVPGLIYPDFSWNSIKELRPFGLTGSMGISKIFLYEIKKPVFKLKR